MPRGNSKPFAKLRAGRHTDEFINLVFSRWDLGDQDGGGGSGPPPGICDLGALIGNYPCQTIHFNAAGIG